MKNAADLIINATKIHTLAGTSVQSLAISEGKLLALGTTNDTAEFADSDTEIISINGVVTPGLIDAHTHVVMGTIWTRGINLTDLSREEVCTALSEQAARTEKGAWLMGWGLDPNIFTEQFDGRVFDEYTADFNAFLRMRDGHSAVVNSTAIATAGLTGAEMFEDESAVGVDSDGAPTGYLLEFAAMATVLAHCPEESIPEIGTRLLERLEDMAACGLTATHVLDLESPALEVVQWIEENHELPIELRFSPMIHPGTKAPQWEQLAALQGTHGRRWRIEGVKFMIDGTIDNGSAWLQRPDHFGEGTKSIWTNTDDYRQALKFFANRGVSTATHAIGDRGVEFVLDCLEELGENRGLAAHRIEHIETIPDETVARFAQLGVAASMQPIHGTHHTKADQSDNWSQRLGAERAEHGWRCRDLRESGATLALGSDWPITPYDPREMMSDSILRRPARKAEVAPVQPDQGLNVLQALEGYTSHAARASNLQHSVGTLATDLYANLTVFAQDPLEQTGQSIADIEVLTTFIKGKDTKKLKQSAAIN
ncbi:amidohydrolase [Glutamicibacter sp.]|uniref:amidohydrolase n=1 Tax=Glutamicibacter sp. TaxID=1931995 RepID=UPI0028BE56E0|nr:amidohydrolase [Glutamicibacter sp.]